MKKFRFYLDFEKEEKWLNQMLKQGWEHVSGSKYSGTQYFKRVNENGDTDIFSDTSSKAARYKRLSNMWLTTAISYFPIFIALILTKAINITAFLNPRELYYTPGLWERTGVYFWKAFLFETPFAVMRGGSGSFFPYSWYCILLLQLKRKSIIERQILNENYNNNLGLIRIKQA